MESGGTIGATYPLFRETCRSCWAPGSNVSINEMMIKFQGRSQHIVKMPKKPIKRGYKVWALCERGYLSNFMYTSKVHATAELQTHPDLSAISSIVAQMGDMLPKDVESLYTLYLDN